MLVIKRKKKIMKEKVLIDEISKLEENYECNQDKKKELEEIRSYKLIGNMIRARAG